MRGTGDRHRDLRSGGLGTGKRERAHRRQLVVAPGRRVPALEVRDPYRAVDSRAANRAGPSRDDLARLTAEHLFAVGSEEMKLSDADGVENPRVSFAGANLPYNRVGAVSIPVDR